MSKTSRAGRKRTAVWGFFEALPQDNKAVHARCKFCGFRCAGVASRMVTHLTVRCPAAPAELRGVLQQKDSTASSLSQTMAGSAGTIARVASVADGSTSPSTLAPLTTVGGSAVASDSSMGCLTRKRERSEGDHDLGDDVDMDAPTSDAVNRVGVGGGADESIVAVAVGPSEAMELHLDNAALSMTLNEADESSSSKVASPPSSMLPSLTTTAQSQAVKKPRRSGPRHQRTKPNQQQLSHYQNRSEVLDAIANSTLFSTTSTIRDLQEHLQNQQQLYATALQQIHQHKQLQLLQHQQQRSGTSRGCSNANSIEFLLVKTPKIIEPREVCRKFLRWCLLRDIPCNYLLDDCFQQALKSMESSFPMVYQNDKQLYKGQQEILQTMSEQIDSFLVQSSHITLLCDDGDKPSDRSVWLAVNESSRMELVSQVPRDLESSAFGSAFAALVQKTQVLQVHGLTQPRDGLSDAEYTGEAGHVINQEVPEDEMNRVTSVRSLGVCCVNAKMLSAVKKQMKLLCVPTEASSSIPQEQEQVVENQLMLSHETPFETTVGSVDVNAVVSMGTTNPPAPSQPEHSKGEADEEVKCGFGDIDNMPCLMGVCMVRLTCELLRDWLSECPALQMLLVDMAALCEQEDDGEDDNPSDDSTNARKSMAENTDNTAPVERPPPLWHQVALLLKKSTKNPKWTSEMASIAQLLKPFQWVFALCDSGERVSSSQFVVVWLWLIALVRRTETRATNAACMDAEAYHVLNSSVLKRLEELVFRQMHQHLEAHHVVAMLLDPRIYGKGLGSFGKRQAQTLVVELASVLFPNAHHDFRPGRSADLSSSHSSRTALLTQLGNYLEQRGIFHEDISWEMVRMGSKSVAAFWQEYASEASILAALAKMVLGFQPYVPCGVVDDALVDSNNDKEQVVLLEDENEEAGKKSTTHMRLLQLKVHHALQAHRKSRMAICAQLGELMLDIKAAVGPHTEKPSQAVSEVTEVPAILRSEAEASFLSSDTDAAPPPAAGSSGCCNKTRSAPPRARTTMMKWIDALLALSPQDKDGSECDQQVPSSCCPCLAKWFACDASRVEELQECVDQFFPLVL